MENQLLEIGKKAKQAAYVLANALPNQKNQALLAAAKAIRDQEQAILEANAGDMLGAKAAGIMGAMLDRLELNEKRIEAMAAGIEAIAALEDPVGKKLTEWQRPNGLKISRISVPLGVIGIIYESRPNVTADAAALCIKSGNGCILRGGGESFQSSHAIAACLQQGLKEAGLPLECVQLIPTKDREAVGTMLKMSEYIDVIIPRGGKGLIKRVIEESRIPLLQHLDGNCHTYVHEKADIAMAANVVSNAKMRRTGICGATESLVIDRVIAPKALPKIAEALKARGCEIRGDKESQAIVGDIIPALDEDYDTEYLDAIISVKVVSGLDEAIDFVNRHGSHHTDAILTEDAKAAAAFLNRVDSAIVMHNTSTQFADGGEFGMGAEIGIATGRLHARGPVGAEQLTTYKYVVEGKGQVRPG